MYPWLSECWWGFSCNWWSFAEKTFVTSNIPKRNVRKRGIYRVSGNQTMSSGICLDQFTSQYELIYRGQLMYGNPQRGSLTPLCGKDTSQALNSLRSKGTMIGSCFEPHCHNSYEGTEYKTCPRYLLKRELYVLSATVHDVTFSAFQWKSCGCSLRSPKPRKGVFFWFPLLLLVQSRFWYMAYLSQYRLASH